MDAFPCILRAGYFPLSILVAAVSLGSVSAQEACLKGCGYPGYPGMVFTLGDGFVAKGGEVKVTHMGFLGQVYNNDGITPRKVGVPNYIGELSVLDPVTGEERFLFRNQKDWVTHENDSGKVISLGTFPKGAPIVFKYVNVDGKEKSYKTFDRYSGDNAAGTYDFNADPLLKNLAINGMPKPVSGGTWNWEGHDYNRWAVAASVPGTDEKQFHFEDADDRIFNDIVFRVSGVALTSETFRLQPPAIAGAANPGGGYQVTLTNSPDATNQASRLFYTLDGSLPSVDSLGRALGSTLEYASAFYIGTTATVKAIAWKATVTNAGNTVKYEPSVQASRTFTVAILQWSKPTATPPGGESRATVLVTLQQAEGARIFYRICDPGVACDAPTSGNTSYTGVPLEIKGSKILKAIAIQSPRDNSEVAVFSFSPSFPVTDAVYLDRNGDGRIDAARITVDGAPVNMPVTVSLEDPFGPGKKREVSSTGMGWESQVPAILRADFAASPFPAGTGFPAGPYGSFPQGGEGFSPGSFTIRDGAGPVAFSSEARVSLDTGSLKQLTVVLSEPLRDPGGPFPFQIKRGEARIDEALKVSRVEALEGNAYRYTFSSQVFPIPGDSLKSTAQAIDAAGNPSAMPGFIAILGNRPVVSVELKVAGGGCVRGKAIANPKPLAIPVNLIVPHAGDAQSGCAEVPGEIRCLDCITGEWERTGGNRPAASELTAGPEIKVTTRWPFGFDLAFFNTLGEFVNRAKGEVTAGMLDGVPADGEGNKTVALQWYPVSESGMQAGTGAYVVKGFVTIKASQARDSFLGIPVEVPAASARVLVRFGYLRD
ncbi:MAG: hypothetical protein JWP91_91 [Fibrobacteres bacterium]|nr:hypothetical protein [Fibrobacterota bacterium]